jgi:hypothetical protein
MADLTPEGRRESLAKGHALPPKHPGGEPRFPVEDKQDLHRALEDYNRIPADEKLEVRRYLTRRAIELDAVQMLPDDWHVTADEGL